jgi:hypothetical protein
MRERGGRRLVPGRREGPADAGHPKAGEIDRGAVVDVMKVGRQIAGRDRVEVVVVAVNPVDRRAERFVSAAGVGDVPDAEPERNLGMVRDDGPRRVECAVNVPERADYFVVCAGTSRSALSQMKSLLL